MMNYPAVAALRKRSVVVRYLRLPNAAAAGLTLLLIFLILPVHASAQSVAVGTITGAAGSAVDLRVNFTAGATGVATLQFDLSFGSALGMVSTTAGSAANNAGKSASGSTVPGGVRVILFGLNQNAISSGEVAIIRLNIASGTPPGVLAVTISNIVASDAQGGNVAASGSNGSVTVSGPTDTNPPLLTAIASSGITQSGATITWTTNEAADSQVEFGLSIAYGNLTVLNSNLVTSHSQALSGLAAGTTYHFRVKSKDAAGNLAISTDNIFITASGGDITPPTILWVTTTGISSAGATVSWTTNEASDSQVEYGLTAAYGTLSAINSSLVTSHAQSLTGLAANSTYHFRVKSRDAAGNLAMSPDFTFTTLPGNDFNPPVIGGVTSTSVTNSSATITWTTNEASDSQVEYGISDSYGSITTRNLSMVTTHAVGLSGLTAEATYHYRVLSRDAAGNTAVSVDFTFVTPAQNDTSIPVIIGVTSSSITSNSARISWTTNEVADTQVEYGATIFYGSTTAANLSLVTSHAQILTGLNAKTVYHYRVKSRDAAGNLAVSNDYIFTTTDSPGDMNPVNTLFYPRLLTSPAGEPGSPDQEFIGFGITNLDNQPARLRFTAYDATGVQVTGAGISNPVFRDLLPGQQIPIIDYQLFGSSFSGPTSNGWVKIESTVSRIAGFFMIFNAGLTELDGANISSELMTSFIYPEVENQGFTRINVANPGTDPAELTIDLMRPDGTVQASGTRSVPANGSLVADLFNDIFPGQEHNGSRYVKVSSNKAVLPFELLGKSAQYLEGLNGQDAAQGSSILYCPQYVIGESWNTSLSVVNLNGTAGSVTFRFIRDDATQSGATKIVPIEAYGKIFIDDAAFFQSFIVAPGGALRQGYLEITSNDVKLAGSVVFGDPAKSSFSSALPLVSTLQQSFLFSHLASNDQYFTGVAILNPGAFDTVVDVDIYNADGTLDLTTRVLVPRTQRISRLLTDLFPELAGQQRTSGYFKLTASQPVASFALFGTRTLSALSAIPPQVIK
jgi:hypothetical protein